MRVPRGGRAVPVFVAVCLLTCASALGSPQEDSSPEPAIEEPANSPASPSDQLVLPGPLRSLLRMAGMSQQLPPQDVLPLLARNVYSLGYQLGAETEFLVLLRRYVRQARQLEALAAGGQIIVSHCSEAGPLLQVLGYRLVNGCGHKDSYLVTLDAENAFLTSDSGFPLTRLEQALQTETPFTYPYEPSRVPVLLKATEWTNLSRTRTSGRQDLLDVLLHDPQVARLYWAFSRMDPETAATLQRSVGLIKLLPYASVLDFYGTQLSIHSKRVVVPGGAQAESGWRELVGASPRSPGEFVLRLVEQDKGWLAAYFDTLARVDPKQQAHLTQGGRLGRLYEAFRGSNLKPEAAGAVYPRAPALLVLFTRQEWLPNGQPSLPANVELWKQILGKRGRGATTPEQVFEDLVSTARLDTYTGPLQIYVSLAALDAARPAQRKPTPQTLLLLANYYPQYSAWYSIFTEFPELSDASIASGPCPSRRIDGCDLQPGPFAATCWASSRQMSGCGRFSRARERFPRHSSRPHGRAWSARSRGSTPPRSSSMPAKSPSPDSYMRRNR